MYCLAGACLAQVLVTHPDERGCTISPGKSTVAIATVKVWTLQLQQKLQHADAYHMQQRISSALPTCRLLYSGGMGVVATASSYERHSGCIASGEWMEREHMGHLGSSGSSRHQ